MSIYHDYDDQDGHFGPNSPSPAAIRADGIIRKAVQLQAVPGTDSNHLKALRAEIRKMQLPAHRLMSLRDAASAHTTLRSLGSFDLTDNAKMARRDCTYGQWRDASWLVCRAAYSVLIEDTRPETTADFFDLLPIVSYMAQYSPRTRARTRLEQRLRRGFGNVLRGLPFNYGLTKQRPAEAAAAPSKKRGRRQHTRAHATRRPVADNHVSM